MSAEKILSFESALRTVVGFSLRHTAEKLLREQRVVIAGMIQAKLLGDAEKIARSLCGGVEIEKTQKEILIRMPLAKLRNK